MARHFTLDHVTGRLMALRRIGPRLARRAGQFIRHTNAPKMSGEEIKGHPPSIPMNVILSGRLEVRAAGPAETISGVSRREGCSLLRCRRPASNP